MRLRTYTLHLPQIAVRGDARALDNAKIVRDGFSWAAFAFTVWWFVYHRLWLAGLFVLMLLVGLALLGSFVGLQPLATFVIWLLASVLIGLEASSLRRWTYARRGLPARDAVIAFSADEAEAKTVARWLDPAAAGGPATGYAPIGKRADDSVIGMFPASEAGGDARTVAIIDYGSGNLHSATKSFERAAREAGLDGTRILVTDRPEEVARADRVVLPGVGAYADCRSGLDAVSGMVDALTHAVQDRKRPFLGICVGMQLMASRGLEYAVTPGLGWIAGDVAPIVPGDPALKIPHMGWNTLRLERAHALLDGLAVGEAGLHAYFVHSYALTPLDRADVVAHADYGGAVTAMVARDNLAGTQFHPEKSQLFGLALIANFLRWRP